MLYELNLTINVSKHPRRSSFSAGEAYTRAVVIAKDEESARKIASTSHGDEGPEVWLSPETCTVTPIDPNGTDELILVG